MTKEKSLDGLIPWIIGGACLLGGGIIGYFVAPEIAKIFGLGEKPNNPIQTPQTIEQIVKEAMQEQQPTQEPNRLEPHYMIDRESGGPVVRSLRPKYTLQRTDASQRVPLPPKPTPRSYRHQVGDLRNAPQRQQLSQLRSGPTEIQEVPKKTRWSPLH